jgi:ribosome-associated translation inhibitor RaiA
MGPRRNFHQIDLRMRGGFSDSDRQMVQRRLAAVDRRLEQFTRRDGWILEVGVKDRDRQSQRVTAEYKSTGRQASVVATSDNADLNAALNEVRDDMLRQIHDTKTIRSDHRR